MRILGLTLIENLSEYYQNADVSAKQKIIGSIVHGFLIYEGNKVRTERINEAVKLLCPQIARFEIKEKGLIQKIRFGLVR